MREQKAIKAHPEKNIFLLHFLSLVFPSVDLPHSTDGCQKLYAIQLKYLNLSHSVSILGNTKSCFIQQINNLPSISFSIYVGWG